MNPFALLIGRWALYTILIFLGSWGAFWVSDEFDQERLWFYGFFLIPVGILFPYLSWFHKRYASDHMNLFRLLPWIVLTGHLWGIILLINAISGDQHVTYTRLLESRAEQKSLRVAYRRGGLGFLYRLRW